MADEHWRGETDRKGGAQGDIDVKTEILEQTLLQNRTHLLFVTKHLRQMGIALTVLHVNFFVFSLSQVKELLLLAWLVLILLMRG